MNYTYANRTGNGWKIIPCNGNYFTTLGLEGERVWDASRDI